MLQMISSIGLLMERGPWDGTKKRSDEFQANLKSRKNGDDHCLNVGVET